MKTTINKEEFKKILLENVEVDIPEETLYFWHNGERVAYSVKPEWTTWNKEQYQKDEVIWRLNVIKVDPSCKRISVHDIQVSELSGIINYSKHAFYRLVQNLLFHPDDDRRTKEQFMVDYKKVLKEIKAYL